MPDSILVVEYEPRYIERVRQALSGHSKPNFAKDGEEAMNMLESVSVRLIVLSSIIPKISTSELIRRIRAIPHHQMTPILITVSGYNGKSPRADAVKLGATDILPKPYSEGEFVNKIKQLLESPAALAPEVTTPMPKASAPDNSAEPTVVVPKMTPADVASNVTTASEDVTRRGRDGGSGDAVDGSEPKAAPRQSKSSAELDKLLETTLSGLQPTPRKPATPKKVDPKKSSAELDKLLETTLSGLELSRPKPTVEKPAPPAPTVEKPLPATPPVEPRVEPAPPQPQPLAAKEPPPLPETTEQMPIPTFEELEAERRRAAGPAAAQPNPAAAETPAVSEGSVPLSSPVIADSSFSAEESEPWGQEEEDEEDGIRFGQYVLLEKIATGGMAEVWKARMRGVEGFQKTVAIKKILPHMSDNEEFLTMFVDEAKLAAQLSHNNIIHIYELGKIDDSYVIAMEYVDGEDLKSIIKRGAETMQPLTIELALFVASKVAAALDYAHRKRGFDEQELGLVHRDVSPQNVLISHEGDIKLCDFGIAKAASKASHTMAGALKGKLQYMSPEQAWGRHIDRRSDIFALATVLFEMLTGHKLFTGDSELSVLEQVREARVAAPSTFNDEVPPEVDAIVLKALAKNSDERYQTAAEMARHLDEVLYTYRPTPTSADLAIHMHRLFVEAQPTAPAMPIMDEPAVFSEPEPEAFSSEPEAFSSEPVALVPPEPIAPPVVKAEPPPAVVEAAPEVAQPFLDSPAMVDVDEEKKFPVVPVAIAAVVLIAAIGSGAFFMMGKKTESGPQTAQISPPPVTAPAAALPTDPLATDTTTTDLVDPEATITDTALDQEAIDEEVQRRLDLERARLDAKRQEDLKRAEEQSANRQREVEETPPPLPATATQAPVETPPVAEPPPPVAEPPPTTTPAPKPQPPAPAAVKEGDLVAVGTPGLVAPSLVKFNKPVYPPVAKLQRVEGIVIVQVLVSETGEVIDAKVLRGVAQDVGINEAALDAIKKSKFKPATKDGVKVKSHYTRTIPFKL